MRSKYFGLFDLFFRMLVCCSWNRILIGVGLGRGSCVNNIFIFLYHFPENLVVSVQEVRLGCRP